MVLEQLGGGGKKGREKQLGSLSHPSLPLLMTLTSK